MQTIEIPLQEYERLTQIAQLVNNQSFVEKLNLLLDLLYEQKYGLFMRDFTEDLTITTLNKSWKNEKSVWDEI